MTGGQPAEGGLTVVADRASGRGRRRQAHRDRLRRSRQISRQDYFPARRDRSPSPRTRCGAARTARDQGPHRPDLRSDLRGGKAPPAQARALSRSAEARLHQRSRLRRLRRLLADLELRLGAAAGDGIRPQAPDRPVELQQGLFLRRGFLPELCHRARRHAEAGRQARRSIRRRSVRRPAVARTPRPLEQPYNILVTGIGGTGVITIGALLGMAAHLDGRGCSALDFTGLAQKNGAVMSHVRIARAAGGHCQRSASRPAAPICMLGCDMVVSASPAALSPRRTRRRPAPSSMPTCSRPRASCINPDIDFEIGAMQRAIRDAVGDDHLDIIDATGIATALMGDSIATNAFMLGFAFQKGLIPLSLEAILRAIELNGAAVEMNKRAFSWGRLAAADMARVRRRRSFRAETRTPGQDARRSDRLPRRLSDRISEQRLRRPLSRSLSPRCARPKAPLCPAPWNSPRRSPKTCSSSWPTRTNTRWRGSTPTALSPKSFASSSTATSA